MMGKTSPKREAINCHAVVTVMTLLTDYLDDFLPESEIAIKVKERASELTPLMEELIMEVYKIPEIKSSTYINDLSNKVDTLMRKSYERIVP